MVMMLCLPAVFTVNAAADDAGSRLPEDTQNLLVNPDWENGTDGWLILANSIKVGYDQDDCLTSIVCQDIPVDDFMYGKAVKLTGSIAVAAEDPTQEAIEISLVMYGSDGNRIRDEYGELLYEEHMTAEDPVMTECGIIMEIPEEAASIRVLMQIWKQGDENIFNFSDLSLELTDVTEIQKPPTNENSGFIRETPIEETEPETTTEPSAESPAATPSEGTGEYTRLEYIAADGTQYIDTGYCDPTGTIIEYRAEWYQNAKGNYDGYMVGARGRDGNGRNGGYYGWNSWILGYGTNYEESNEPAFREGKAYDVRSSTVAGDAWLEVDGIRIAENTDVRGLSPSPIMVFTTESQLSDELNTCGRIFYARIYDHYGILVRDYVPCIRNADGEVGMLDLVDYKFYGNDGAGEFTKGPAAGEVPEKPAPSPDRTQLDPEGYSQTEYIIADGTQYIDTGYADIHGTIIEYRAEWNLNAKGQYDGYMAGARGRDGNGRNGGYYGWNSWILGYGTNYEESKEPAFTIGKAYDVRSSTVSGDAWLEVDGTRVAECTDERELSMSPIMIFTTESQLSDELNTCGRIFYARIYDHSGNLVRDYVPCIRNYDGAAGMFDLVENRFYGNDGTGEFRSGPILDITLYESGGQQLTPPPVDPETETDDIETGRTGIDDTGRLNENEIRYMQDGSVMYNGHRYKIIQEAMYWEDAWDYCDELGGYLVTITSAQEQALMEKILKDSDAHGKFMIGLGSLDGDLRNAFEWITREPLEYTNWGEGEPDGGQPVCILSTEDISGSHFHIRPYQWDDDTYNQYFFICEWEPETIVSSIPFNDIESQNTDTAYLKDLVEQGKGYYYGTGPEGYSRDKAEQCFKEAADSNYGEGWYYLGNMYMNSLMDQPYVRAMECYQKAVDRGFGLGLVCQALLYENGYGAEQDFAKAYELYSMAVEAGFQEGCCGLGNLYKDGNGVLQDELAAMEYYKMALDSQDFMWRNFAKCMIGKMYEKGAPGISQDYSQAMDWYLQAAEEGYGRGYCCIGDMYFYGNGVEKDRGEAFGWFKLAAEHGDITGMYDTAFLLDHALGVTQDYTEAMKYYRMAASIGDADAMYALGCMYEEGHGVSQDFEQAKYWLEQALKYAGDDIELKESIGEEMAYISSGAY